MPDPEHHEAGVKPSAGAMRISSRWHHEDEQSRSAKELAAYIDEGVRQLLAALEKTLSQLIVALDGRDPNCYKGFGKEARAALAAWRGDA